MITGKEHTLDVPCSDNEYTNYLLGTHIQRAMPNVSPELREFVLNGITPEEWKEHMGEEE